MLPTVVQGYGVYRYADKYGANVDGYSPIYTPDTWSETGATYNLGLEGPYCMARPQACRLRVVSKQGRIYGFDHVCKQ